MLQSGHLLVTMGVQDLRSRVLRVQEEGALVTVSLLGDEVSLDVVHLSVAAVGQRDLPDLGHVGQPAKNTVNERPLRYHSHSTHCWDPPTDLLIRGALNLTSSAKWGEDRVLGRGV